MSKHTRLGLVALLTLPILLAPLGCTAPPPPTSAAPLRSSPPVPPSTSTPSVPAPRSTDPDVVDAGGFRDIRIGASLTSLVSAGAVVADDTGCGPRFTAFAYASPVFDGENLVLIWAHPPLRTPEGVMAGTPLATARQTYPTATSLTPPAGSTQYAGMLVPDGTGNAYLLLHDSAAVQKLIVGVERHARLLFESGFGAC